jgi:CRISPR-associated protein Cas2
MRVVVCYEVVEDRKRNRLAKAPKKFLTRVQKSVFEGGIQERKYGEMKSAILKKIDREVDSVRIYYLCLPCYTAVEVIGTAVFLEVDEQEVIV